MSAQDNLSSLQFPHQEMPGGYHKISAVDGPDEVGWLQYKNDQASEYSQPGEISALGVSQEYQHQGVATRMYQEAQKYGPVVHSQKRTSAGDSWAQKVGGPVQPLRPEGLMNPIDPPPIQQFRRS